MADYLAGTKARYALWFNVPSPHGTNIRAASAFIGALGAVSNFAAPLIKKAAGIGALRLPGSKIDCL
jgi:hypothetical protein